MKKEKEKIIQIAVCPSNQIIVLTNQGEIYCQEKNEYIITGSWFKIPNHIELKQDKHKEKN